jgi:hypothetical protein
MEEWKMAIALQPRRDDVERVPDRFLDPDRVIAEGTAAEAGEKDYVRDPRRALRTAASSVAS